MQHRLALFRQEALDAQREQAAGTILLLRPVPMRLAALVAGVLALALAVVLATGSYTRKARIAGLIAPADGALAVVAPQPGRVAAVRVADGQQVAAGQVLYELSSGRVGRDGLIEERIAGALGERRRLLQQELSLQDGQLRQRERELRDRLVLLEAESTRLDQELALQQARTGNAERLLAKYRALREQGFLSEMQLLQAENDLHDQQSRRQALERAQLAVRRDLLSTGQEAQRIGGQARLSAAQLSRGMAGLDQEAAEHEGRHRVRIVAPAAGTVTALAAEAGQAVAAGMPLATVLPAGSSLEARLLAPSSAIGFIAPGQRVLIRVAAFPYQKFGQLDSRVLRVEQSPAPDAQPAQGGRGEPYYRVVVSLPAQSMLAYGKPQPLRTGMTVEADVQLDRRRLFEWMIEPLLGAARKFSQ